MSQSQFANQTPLLMNARDLHVFSAPWRATGCKELQRETWRRNLATRKSCPVDLTWPINLALHPIEISATNSASYARIREEGSVSDSASGFARLARPPNANGRRYDFEQGAITLMMFQRIPAVSPQISKKSTESSGNEN